MYTMLCSFNPTSGWRVHKVIPVATNAISVVERNAVKLLSIPVMSDIRPGRFCNPRKLIMEAVRSLNRAFRYQPAVEVHSIEPNLAPEQQLRRIQQACEAVKF